MIRRILLSLLAFTLLLILSTSTYAQYSKLQGYAGKGGKAVTISSITTSDKFQQTFPSCAVTVYLAGTTTLASIYSNNLGTPKANPFTAASDASWSFYVAPGVHVDIQFSGSFSTFTYGDLVAPSSGISGAVNLKDFGAKGDGRISTNASMAPSSNLLNCSDCNFTSADRNKLIDVNGVGAAATLSTIISTYISSTQVTISVKASYTVSGATVSLDAATISTGAITANTATLTVGSSFFTPDDVGKIIQITNAGAANITGTINSINSSTQVVLSVSSSALTTTITSRKILYGTDDHASLVSWIATGNQNYIPTGFYINSAALSLSTSNKSITGDGLGASVIYTIGPKQTTTNLFNCINIVQPASNISFNDVGFSGTNWYTQHMSVFGPSADGVAVDVTGPISGVTAINCRFDNFWGIGFHAPGSAGASCVATNAVTDIKLIGCKATGNAYDGLNPNPACGLIVQGCTLNYNGTAGMETSVYNQVAINGNTARYNLQGGVSLGGFGDPSISKGASITGNTFEFNGQYGLTLASNQAYSVVTGNVFRANGLSGISCSKGGSTTGNKHSLIAANVISSNGATGFVGTSSGIVSDHDSYLIQNNKVIDEGITGYQQDFGILIFGTNNNIWFNEVTGNAIQDYSFQIAGTTNDLIYTTPTSVIFITGGATVTRGTMTFDSISAQFFPNTSVGIANFGIDAASGPTLTVTNGSVARPFSNSGNFSGLVLVNDPTITGATGLFLVSGFGTTLVAVQPPGAMTVTSGTAGKTNLYLNGSNAVEIQNNTGSTITYRVLAIRMRAFP